MIECIRPGEISDEDLIGFAAGEAPRRVKEHVRACQRCTALAADYANLESRLGRTLFRLDCPSSIELGEYALGLLPVSTQRRVEAHLTSCPHCTAELATADDFFRETAPVATLVATPIERAEQAVANVGRAVQRIVAQLVSTPSVAPAMALRGNGRPVTLVYTAGDLTLTLHPQAADKPRDQVQLLGFVHRHAATLDSLNGTRVRLLSGEQTIGVATIDEIGNFIIGPVPAGHYDLELVTDVAQIVVTDLPLMVKR